MHRRPRRKQSPPTAARRNGRHDHAFAYESLEPRQLLAGDFAPYVDLNIITDWSAIHGTGGFNDKGEDVLIQPDGKLVVTGVLPKTIQQASQDLLVARYNEDGTIDTGFGGAGYALADFGTIHRDIGNSVALQDDGKIVAVGTSYDYFDTPVLSDHYLIAARFNSDGSLDATYMDGDGPDAEAPGTQPYNDFLYTNDVLVHSSGRIWIISSVKNTNDKNSIMLTGLNSNFEIDPTFGDNGRVIHNYGDPDTPGVTGYVMAEQPDGKVVIGGNRGSYGYFARFNSDGSLDTTYATGGEGILFTVQGTGVRNNFSGGVFVDANDNAYFSGSSDVSADSVDTEVIVVRFDHSGNLDTTFGVDGVFRYNPTAGGEGGGEITMDKTGRLALIGNNQILWVNQNGTLDEVVDIEKPGNDGTLRGIAVDSANRVVATGDATNPTNDVWLVRASPNVEFADSFENGQWNGLWIEDSQNDWFTSTQRETDGNYSAEVDGRATDATLTVANSIDMSNYGSAELTFDWYIESGFDSGEYVKLDFWNGSNWIEIRSLDGDVDSENTWHTETVYLENKPSGDYLRSDFQFRFRANVSSSTEDANVDNVRLLATSLSGPPNEGPGITTSPVTEASEDSLYSYNVDAVDPDPGDVITFSLDTAPAGMTINATTGFIRWTPTNDDVGSHSVVVQAEDAGGLFDTQSFNIVVANVNDTPVITSTPVTSATEDSLYSYDVDAIDRDVGDSLTFLLDLAPTGMSIDSSSGLIEWTPTNGQIGNQSVTVQVVDAIGSSDTQSFSITVAPAGPTETVLFSDSFEVGSNNNDWNGNWIEDSQNDFFRSTQRARPTAFVQRKSTALPTTPR